jgi:2-hydroxychromene-2-carboxylate isomerase
MNSLPARPLPGRLARSLVTVVMQKVKERTYLSVKSDHDVGHGVDQHSAPVVRRVFATPTVFEGNEMFLCNDHFDFIEEALRKFI